MKENGDALSQLPVMQQVENEKEIGVQFIETYFPPLYKHL